MEPSMNPVVLFTYPESVVGRRTEWYLSLRGIPYKKCRVDSKMPRPVLDRLDVHYRRIPILTVGRNIYCDSRCIIDHLERLYPNLPRLGSNKLYERGIERILESWVFDGPPFMRTASLITPDASLVQEQAWLDDRAELTGWQFSAERLSAGATDALCHARLHLRVVEEELLADGRRWLSGGEQPSLADIHLLWVFDWMWRPKELMGMAHAYPSLLNEQNYPRVVAWIRSMEKAFDAAQRSSPSDWVSDDEAIALIESSRYFESEVLKIDTHDPTRLVRGELVDLIALDSAPATGIARRDIGPLEGLTVTSVAIRTRTTNDVDIRIHYQRANVRVARAGDHPRLNASQIK